MMYWREEKTMKEQKDKLLKEFFELTENLNFARELNLLCLASDSYGTAAELLERYAEKDEQDKKTLRELEENVLRAELDYYSTFVEFVKKYNSESSRVHSLMGSKTSDRKKATSAENGKKGGRPRKKPLETL